MPLSHMEHFLIQTTDMAGTRDWYVEVLGLEEGPHPELDFAAEEARGMAAGVVASELPDGFAR